MVKSGGFEGGPAVAAKAMELKTEFQKSVKEIFDDEDVDLEAIDRSLQVLRSLKELKLKKSLSLDLRNHCHRSCLETVSGAVPEEFKCPLSKELMTDPVIIANGQTFERSFIQKWLKSGNRTCPRTQLALAHTVLTPNLLIQEMIKQWCKNHEIKLPDSPKSNSNFIIHGLVESDRDHFLSLLEKMSSNLYDQKKAAKELRLLTKRMPSFRALFGESLHAIPQLLAPLSQSDVHPDLQEDLITTVLNLSIHDNNKKLVAETPAVIPLLIAALTSGTVETRSNSAAALFTLSALDSNKALIGKSSALKPLIHLLDQGHPLVMKDVASAIFSLCIIHENKARAVEDGAVRVILEKITSRVHVDELLSILAMLSSNQKAVEEMGELGAVSCLLGLMRETACDRNKENCAAVLYTICCYDRSKWNEIRNEERIHGTVSQLARNGTSRARRKAAGILDRLNRGVNLLHTA